jgi:hypothetical protein
MNSQKLNSLILACLVLAQTGFTYSAETTKPKRGGWCICNAFRGPESPFNCEHIGVVTIAQIYDKGWRVVLKQDLKGFNIGGITELIIEEQ